MVCITIRAHGLPPTPSVLAHAVLSERPGLAAMGVVELGGVSLPVPACRRPDHTLCDRLSLSRQSLSGCVRDALALDVKRNHTTYSNINSSFHKRSASTDLGPTRPSLADIQRCRLSRTRIRVKGKQMGATAPSSITVRNPEDVIPAGGRARHGRRCRAAERLSKRVLRCDSEGHSSLED